MGAINLGLRNGETRTMRMKFFVVVVGCLLMTAGVEADTVTLSTGETLTGTITSHTAESLVLEHPVLGTLTIPAGQVTSPVLGETAPVEVADAEDDVVAVKAVAETAEATVKATTGLTEDLLAGWDSTVDIGLNGADGNNDNISLYLALVSKKENDEGRWKLDSSYRYGQQDGSTRTNRYTAGLVRDWYVSDRLWFYFADLRYDWDQFQDWQSRVAGHVGLGYKLVQEEDLTVELRGGIGAVREFGSTDNTFRPEALAGVDVEWAINEHQSLGATTRFYPDLEDSGEFRAVSNADWKLKLQGYETAAFKVGVKHEHQSLVDPGTENDDFWYYAALSFGF